jgi:leucyl/phenylalanyl-tRNA---protein transferase
MAVTLPARRDVLHRLARLPFPVRQTLLGFAYLLTPRRLPNLLPLTAIAARDLLCGSKRLPEASWAIKRPDGLCGLAGHLSVPALLAGYGRGLYVHSHLGPLKWWAPEHRMVLFFDQARVDKTVRRLLNHGRFRVSFDTAFADVMRACAEPRPGRTPLTWITPRIQDLFLRAHDAGHAHSIEVWQGERLVGGVYGLAVGRLFFTESLFHRVHDASKVGLAVLNRHLQSWGFILNDGKHPTAFLADCGMAPITRAEFSRLAELYRHSRHKHGCWQIDPALLAGDWKPGEAGGVCMQDLLPNGSACKWTAAQLIGDRRSNSW